MKNKYQSRIKAIRHHPSFFFILLIEPTLPPEPIEVHSLPINVETIPLRQNNFKMLFFFTGVQITRIKGIKQEVNLSFLSSHQPIFIRMISASVHYYHFITIEAAECLL